MKQQYLPPSLKQAFRECTWPKGRISGSPYKMLHMLSDIDFELTRDLPMIESDTSDIAKLESLILQLGDPSWHLCSGSSDNSQQDLPWLDLNQATVIGGGADYGDDLWLVLDTRFNREDPRVVHNRFSSSGVVTWHELCPTLGHFIKLAAGAKA